MMRLSIGTLILLAREGDKDAEYTAVWLDKNRDAVAVSLNGGRLGAGWDRVELVGMLKQYAEDHGVDLEDS